MIINPKMILKNGAELTDNELAQINEAVFREFKVSPSSKDKLEDKLFFLLKKSKKILAMGGLLEVKPVIFDGTKFTIYGFVNVIANIKGKGYGKKVVKTMMNYLADNNKTGLGFCMPKILGFYEKCGLNIDTISTKRFVYKKGNRRITNQDGQLIFYQDSKADFMKKVLLSPEEEISIPTEGLW